MKNITFYLLLLFATTSFSQSCDTSPQNALEFHAKEAVICGEVNQVYSPNYTKGNPTYLNMGGKFPNHTFTVVVWGDDAEKMKLDLSKLEGRRVAVTGIVREYEGKPQIVIKNDSQIKIMVRQ